MKKYVVHVNVDYRANIQDTFVIEAESTSDPAFRAAFYKNINYMCDGMGMERMANTIDDYLEGDSSPFYSVNIYEVANEVANAEVSDLTKWFVNEFVKDEKEAEEKRKQQVQAQRKQEYLRLKKEFEA